MNEFPNVKFPYKITKDFEGNLVIIIKIRLKPRHMKYLDSNSKVNPSEIIRSGIDTLIMMDKAFDKKTT